MNQGDHVTVMEMIEGVTNDLVMTTVVETSQAGR